MKRTIATLFMALALSMLASAAFMRPVPYPYTNSYTQQSTQSIMMMRMVLMFLGI